MNNLKILLLMFFVSILLIGYVSAADKYVTVTGAGSHTGTLGNEWTLREAATNVVAGDTVYIATGDYNLGSSSISFSKNGVADSPITWIGTISLSDYDINTVSVSSGSQSTLIRTNESSSNNAISLSGDYNTFKNIVFQQNSPGKQLIGISGAYITLDGVATKYPSNVGSSSNHMILITGEHVTLRYSTFNQGSRTIIWARKNSGTQADYFTMEYCTLKGATNHPPLQIMPRTDGPTPAIKGAIVRNNLFIDNPYGNLYTRYNERFAIYNNLFIRSGSPYDVDIHEGLSAPDAPVPSDVNDGQDGIIAYNTIIENSVSNIIYNKGTTNINFVNNIFYSTYAIGNAGYLFRYDSPWNTNVNQNNDYNLYYYLNKIISQPSPIGLRGSWGSLGWVYYPDWASRTGQEQHTLVDIAPTFVSIANDNYAPLSASSPQVGKGIPITQANGFWMDITTDYYGNPRDPVHPTLGAIEYGSSGGSGGPPIVADTNMDGCVSLGEISTYVGRWLNGQITLGAVSGGVSEWLGGC